MEQERYASFEMPVRCGHELEMRHESALKKKAKKVSDTRMFVFDLKCAVPCFQHRENKISPDEYEIEEYSPTEENIIRLQRYTKQFLQGRILQNTKMSLARERWRNAYHHVLLNLKKEYNSNLLQTQKRLILLLCASKAEFLSQKPLRSGLECNICFNKERNILFSCGHIVCCKGCARHISKCPICREDISNEEVVYIS